MHNAVIRHLARNRDDYTIAAILVVLIGMGLLQAVSMPDFEESSLTNNVANVVTGKKPVTFFEERHFNVARGDEVTFTLKTEPNIRVDYFLVHPDRKMPALHQESSGTDSSGMTTYTGRVSDRMLAGVTYDVGVQVTLPNQGEKLLVMAPYSVTLDFENAAAPTSTGSSFNE